MNTETGEFFDCRWHPAESLGVVVILEEVHRVAGLERGYEVIDLAELGSRGWFGQERVFVGVVEFEEQL